MCAALQKALAIGSNRFEGNISMGTSASDLFAHMNEVTGASDALLRLRASFNARSESGNLIVKQVLALVAEGNVKDSAEVVGSSEDGSEGNPHLFRKEVNIVLLRFAVLVKSNLSNERGLYRSFLDTLDAFRDHRATDIHTLAALFRLFHLHHSLLQELSRLVLNAEIPETFQIPRAVHVQRFKPPNGKVATAAQEEYISGIYQSNEPSMACNALPVFDPKGVHAVPISLVSRLKKPPQLNVRTRLLRNGSGSASVNSISNGPASAPPFVAVGRRKGSTSSIQSISASSSNESNGSGSLSVEATVPKAAGVGSRRSTRSYAAASSSIHSAEKRTEDMLSIDQFNGPTQHAFQSSFLVPGMKRKRGRPLKSASSSNDSTRTASPTSEFSRSNRQEHRLSSRSSLGRAMIDAETSKKTNSSEPHLAASVIAKLSSHTMDKQSPRKGFKYHTNFLATSTASPLSLLAEAAAASSQQPTNPTQNLLSASPNRFSPKANFDPTKISIQIPISKSPAKPPPCPRLPSPAHPDDPPLAPMHAQSMTYILKRMRCHVAAAPFLETARAPLAFHLGAMLERLNGGGYESALAFRRDFDGMVGLLRDRVAARKGGAVGVEAKEVDFDASCVLKLETYFGNEWAHFFPEFLARRRKGPVAGSDERGVKKARK